MGQRHPEGEQLLLSPPVLPLLLPPHLSLCLLVTALMLGLTDGEPLPHFDVRPRCQFVCGDRMVCRQGKTAVMSLPGLPSNSRRIDES